MYGTLSRTGNGRFALRFERRFPHPPWKVWRAITEPEQLSAWFVAIVDYERSQLSFDAGADLVFVPSSQDLPTGRGRVLRVDPPRLLEYTWDGEVLRWELHADGEAGCRLVFTNIVDDHGTAAAVAPGWHAGLDGLAAVLDGRPVDPSAMERLQETYARVLG